jgi:hypothetical protein
MKPLKKSTRGYNISALLLPGLLLVLVLFLVNRIYLRNEGRIIRLIIRLSKANKERQIIEMYLRIMKYLPVGQADPLIVTAQAMVETDDFTSSVFANNNNLFGMRRAKVRETTAIGEKGGYALYRSIKDSIIDLSMWLSWNSIPFTNNSAEYCQALYLRAYYEVDYQLYLSAVNSRLVELNDILIRNNLLT